MKKAVFVNPKFYYTIINYIKGQNKEKPKVYCRNSVLLPISIGITFNVHNGKDYLKVYVSKSIIGHKLGEFSGSRRRYFFKKGKVKQKLKK